MIGYVVTTPFPFGDKQYEKGDVIADEALISKLLGAPAMQGHMVRINLPDPPKEQPSRLVLADKAAEAASNETKPA